MKNLTAIVISFLRPDYTIACIESLRSQYPDIKIVVGENGHHSKELARACDKVGAKYVELPFDSGVCYARNALVKEVNTKYVMVGDDDFFYTNTAKVDKMQQFLENHEEYDLIGGRVSVDGVKQNYQGYIEKHPTHFQSHLLDVDKAEFEIDEVSDLRYCAADLTFNYFVARTAKVLEVPWDEEIKVAYEHYSWFYDFKCAGGKVAFSPDPIVVHKPAHIRKKVEQTENHREYTVFRNRKSDQERFFKKYKIKYTISMNGRKTYAPDFSRNLKSNNIKHVDFCITTFKRQKALERLLYSIAEYAPCANVYVADQNEQLDMVFYKNIRAELQKLGLHKRLSVKGLPYDCGLSYARNYLVTETPNKYKLILDDDFVFTPETDIGKMVALMDDHPNVGIVGGLVRQHGHDIHFEFELEKKGNTIYQVDDKQPMRTHKGIRYKKTGCVLNFALMRGDIFLQTGWDNDLKVTEHMDFYLRFKNTKYQVFYTPDVVIDHPPTEREPDYKELRQRKEFMVHMLKKHGVNRVKYLNGQVTEIEGNSLKRYKEKI